MEKIQQTLQQYFGFDSLRSGQDEVITRLLEGKSTAAIFPTGSGKSLCYQLPALHLPHLTLVISPLLALMKDQLDFLHSKNIPAASIDSSQSWDQSQQVMQAVRNGEIKILLISVERLKNERFRQFIANIPLSLLVVDEAHCISEWGHNFRPDYLKLPHYRQALNIPQVLLLTATATPEVIEDMRGKFSIAENDIVVTGFYRQNLDLAVLPAVENDKINQLSRQLLATDLRPTIVYVTLQHTAETVARQLREQGLSAKAYHAGMDSDKRQQIQHDFMSGATDCIVATIAFGMGIDKADIRRVIHYDLPKSIENYSQEIGRAGRDGITSHCTVLANKEGLNVLENFIYGDTPDLDAIRFVLDEIKQSNGQWEVMLPRLSRESNIRLLPLKTLLVYLEMSQIIESKYSHFADYRFKYIQDQQTILNQFQGERRDFVACLLNCSPKARTWCKVDFDAIWLSYRAERKRAVAAIDYLNEKGWIELESKQMVDVYAVLNRQFDTHSEALKLYQLFKQKEHSEIDRINKMIGFFESSSCLSHELAGYFADFAAPEQCGHCSVCRGDSTLLPPSQPLPDVSAATIKAWCQPLIAASDRQVSPEVLTRFLCGITTPLTTKLKATKMPGFGQLAAYPFAKVLALVNNSDLNHNALE